MPIGKTRWRCGAGGPRTTPKTGAEASAKGRGTPGATGGVVTEWVEQHADRLEIFYLPVQAPELNPDEYLNNEVKGTVNESGLARTEGELVGKLGRLLQRLVELPQHVASFFQHPRVAYAA